MEPYTVIHRPEGTTPSSGWPAILFIPGKGSHDTQPPQRWGILQSYRELAAAAECVGVVLSYRRQQADVTAAIGYVRNHANELGIDANRLALWAFSGAGALLSEFLRQRPAYIRCLLAFDTVLDLTDLDEDDMPVFVA